MRGRIGAYIADPKCRTRSSNSRLPQPRRHAPRSATRRRPKAARRRRGGRSAAVWRAGLSDAWSHGIIPRLTLCRPGTCGADPAMGGYPHTSGSSGQPGHTAPSIGCLAFHGPRKGSSLRCAHQSDGARRIPASAPPNRGRAVMRTRGASRYGLRVVSRLAPLLAAVLLLLFSAAGAHGQMGAGGSGVASRIALTASTRMAGGHLSMHQLFAMGSDGSGKTGFTNECIRHHDRPTWSPDGAGARRWGHWRKEAEYRQGHGSCQRGIHGVRTLGNVGGIRVPEEPRRRLPAVVSAAAACRCVGYPGALQTRSVTGRAARRSRA